MSVSDFYSRRPAEWDPLTSPLSDGDFCTRHHRDALSTAELAAAYVRSQRGTLYRSEVTRRETVARRILRRLRRIVT